MFRELVKLSIFLHNGAFFVMSSIKCVLKRMFKHLLVIVILVLHCVCVCVYIPVFSGPWWSRLEGWWQQHEPPGSSIPLSAAAWNMSPCCDTETQNIKYSQKNKGKANDLCRVENSQSNVFIAIQHFLKWFHSLELLLGVWFRPFFLPHFEFQMLCPEWLWDLLPACTTSSWWQRSLCCEM